MITLPRVTGELRQVLSPQTAANRWKIFYVLLAIVLIIDFNFVASHYRTYNIPRGSVELTVPYVTYLVGEPITFTLKNNFDSAIYVPNECPDEPLSVYKQMNGTWQRLRAATSVSSCTSKDRQIKVEAHGTRTGSYAAWQSLFSEAGKYRIVAYVDYFNIAPYQDFEVIATPQKAKNYVQVPATTTTPSQSSDTKTRPSQPTSSTGAPGLTAYSVSASGNTIRVEYSATYIYVRSISPAPGCGYEGGRSGTSVEVTFKCPGRETQIQLWVSGGKIHQKIE